MKGRVYWLPVASPRNTEVLGSRVSTKTGKAMWDKLDWRNWWIDGPSPHMFNAGGRYFHVKTNEGDGTVFRVRCWYAGGKYRGHQVRDIGIGLADGQLQWLVHVESKPTTEQGGDE